MLKKMYAACFLCFLMMTSLIYTQNTTAQIEVEKLTDHILVLKNGGGNVAVYIGEDSVLIIDTMLKAFTESLIKTLHEIAPDKPVRFVINTHWHFDHVEGNEAIAKQGALIIAHENVLKRMSTEQYIEFFGMKFPPSPAMALPKLTFSHNLTLNMGQEEIYITHVQPGHTDGDAIIFFRKSNVVHLGDLYFAGMYPFIDTSTGGSITNMITVLRYLLPMFDDSTKLISGHGPITGKTELKAYITMLTTIREKFVQEIKSGKTLEQMLAENVNQELDAVWGKGFLKPEQWIKLLYSDLKRDF